MTTRQTDRLLQVGLAGCGAIAPLHAQAICATGQAELVALIDPDPAAVARLQVCWQETAAASAPRSYADLTVALQDDQLDVVHICTPHHTHVPLAVQALEQGCHVLLEKPPGISFKDLADLSEAVSRNSGRLGICFQNRFNPASQQAGHLLQSGKVGPVRTVRAFVTWKRDAAYYAQAAWRGRWATEGGGVMINQAIHTLDLLIWLAGRPLMVEGTIANRHLRDAIEVEDTAEMLLQLENDITAVFYATSAYGSDAPVFLELDCGEHRLRLEGDHLQLLDAGGRILPQDQLQTLLSAQPAWTPEDATDAIDDATAKACWGQGHQRLIRSFYASLQADCQTFPIDLTSGSYALSALLALYESHRIGEAVSL